MHTTRDLANLLQLMQTSRQSGDLIIEPHVQSGTPWHGLIRLVDGQIAISQIRSKVDGRIGLRDNEAVRWLTRPERGKLQWSLDEPAPPTDNFLPVLPANDEPGRDEYSSMDSTAPYPIFIAQNDPNIYNNTYPAPLSDANVSRPYPSGSSVQPRTILRRTDIGNKAPALALSSRELRQVFALIDGHRTIEEIVRLLHKSPEIVNRLLEELKASKLVE